MNNQLKDLERQLNDAKRLNEGLTEELSQKKQTLNRMQEQNKLYQIYNDLKKGNIDYKVLMSLDDIPIPDDLRDAIQERSQFESQFSNTEKKVSQVVNFLAGQDKSQEILQSETKTIELLDDYIKISNEILNGL